MLDFSNADEQKEFPQGPVPAGSIVIVQMNVLQPAPNRQAGDNPFISVSQSGLRQIYCQFDVVKGTYAGVNFRQNITLPGAAQKISLSPNFEKACNIGASQLKAMCLAAKRQPKVNNIQELSGMRFPVKVKINNRSREANGNVYWHNEIALVITPDKPEYDQIRQKGEIINPNGAVVGKDASNDKPQPQDNGDYDFGACVEEQHAVDEVPF